MRFPWVAPSTTSKASLATPSLQCLNLWRGSRAPCLPRLRRLKPLSPMSSFAPRCPPACAAGAEGRLDIRRVVALGASCRGCSVSWPTSLPAPEWRPRAWSRGRTPALAGCACPHRSAKPRRRVYGAKRERRRCRASPGPVIGAVDYRISLGLKLRVMSCQSEYFAGGRLSGWQK
jgi:hypothetical protein